MLLTNVLQVAASAVVVTLVGGCARNMLETVNTVKEFSALSSSSPPKLPEVACQSTEAMLMYLQSLSRKELLLLFCASPAPSDLDVLLGEWSGILLDNNDLGMTRIGSKFMSNVLFGKGRPWNGKMFGQGGKGMNRFRGKYNGAMQMEHSFDFSLQESILNKGTKSVLLDYSKYQFPLSLWRTMKDEVRCLPCGVLIGFGCMAWSGGMRNAAPFCLYPESTPISLGSQLKVKLK